MEIRNAIFKKEGKFQFFSIFILTDYNIYFLYFILIRWNETIVSMLLSCFLLIFNANFLKIRLFYFSNDVCHIQFIIYIQILFKYSQSITHWISRIDCSKMWHKHIWIINTFNLSISIFNLFNLLFNSIFLLYTNQLTMLMIPEMNFKQSFLCENFHFH